MEIIPSRAGNIAEILRGGVARGVGHFAYILQYLLVINIGINCSLKQVCYINKFTRT